TTVSPTYEKSFTGSRDLNAEFNECSNNSSNGVNDASSTVPTVGHNFINGTNTFSAAGLSNTTVSPTYEKSFTGSRDLNAEFNECSNNSSNGVNDASSTVPTVGHNFINGTNTFSAAGLSNTTVSPTYEKSFTGSRDLNAEFNECSNNSSNGVNDASSTVPTVGHNFINGTNTFSAAGLSNTTDELKRVHQALKDPS
nr:hypothetical protein [Tanacetum cinerariifolium]